MRSCWLCLQQTSEGISATIVLLQLAKTRRLHSRPHTALFRVPKRRNQASCRIGKALQATVPVRSRWKFHRASQTFTNRLLGIYTQRLLWKLHDHDKDGDIASRRRPAFSSHLLTTVVDLCFTST